VKQLSCAVGELCGKDTWSGRRERQEAAGDDWLQNCCAWPRFNERQN